MPKHTNFLERLFNPQGKPLSPGEAETLEQGFIRSSTYSDTLKGKAIRHYYEEVYHDILEYHRDEDGDMVRGYMWDYREELLDPRVLAVLTEQYDIAEHQNTFFVVDLWVRDGRIRLSVHLSDADDHWYSMAHMNVGISLVQVSDDGIESLIRHGKWEIN